MMRIDMAADHGEFELKVQLTVAPRAASYEVQVQPKRLREGAKEISHGDV
jgi:hypothetical protein